MQVKYIFYSQIIYSLLNSLVKRLEKSENKQ